LQDPDPQVGQTVLSAAKPQLTLAVTPELATLPVFVHAGAILPIAPLVESTNQTPNGPLTLRVYAGNDCSGTLYQDDGRTYAYQNGVFLRENFTCAITPAGFTLRASPQEGTYPAWWKEIRVEVYGWKPSANAAHLDGATLYASIEPAGSGFVITVPANAKGFDLELR
jgi:alpha-glucosidase